jgi:3-methylcrotonyl-CoA carboxylase alpha subunit
LQQLLTPAEMPPAVLFAFALAELHQQRSVTPSLTGWSLNNALARTLMFYQNDDKISVDLLAYNGREYQFKYLNNTHWVSAHFDKENGFITMDGSQVSVSILVTKTHLIGGYEGKRYSVERPQARQAHAYSEEWTGSLRAPLPGKIVKVLVKLHENVAKGCPVVVLEAMKMEHTILAPHNGTVKAIHYGEGDRVSEGADLLDLIEDASRDVA